MIQIESMQEKIDRVIINLCEYMLCNIPKKPQWTENMLRRELVACILGSQVRYEMAKRALEYIEEEGLLHDSWWCGNSIDCNDQFEERIYNALAKQIDGNQKTWSYRFPKMRARQIAAARVAISVNNLSEILYENPKPLKLREQLVSRISGLGPKQASMFLRNIGFSYDLAILDTHILNFMKMKNMICDKKQNISTIKSYENVEQTIIDYSDSLGYPVGLLDLAIWVTIKAAKEMDYGHC